jgi:outer membrane receptor protein involved in Fe transport
LVSETLFSWSFDHPHSGLGDSLDADKIDRTKVGLGALPSFFQTENGNILPQIDPGGVYPGFNFNRFPVFARANEWQYSSTWTWTRGAHIMKFGGMYIRNTKAEIDGSQEKGVFNFGVNTASDFDTGYSPANMVTGALNQFRQVSNIMQKNSLYQDVHFFAQDTWKVTPRLTLDFGLRASHMPTEFNRYPDQTLDAVFLPSPLGSGQSAALVRARPEQSQPDH